MLLSIDAWVLLYVCLYLVFYLLLWCICSAFCRSLSHYVLYNFFYNLLCFVFVFFFFSSRRRHTRFDCDWSSDVCSSDLCRSCSRSSSPPISSSPSCRKARRPRPRGAGRCCRCHASPGSPCCCSRSARWRDRKSVV